MDACPTRLVLVAINVLCGLEIVHSYFYCTARDCGWAARSWTSASARFRGRYTALIWFGLAGYLLSFHHIVWRMDVATPVFPGGLTGALFVLPFVLILLPSVLWIPTTYDYLKTRSPRELLRVQMVRYLVAAGSLILLVMLALLKPFAPEHFSWPSTVGAALFASFVLTSARRHGQRGSTPKPG